MPPSPELRRWDHCIRGVGVAVSVGVGLAVGVRWRCGPRSGWRPLAVGYGVVGRESVSRPVRAANGVANTAVTKARTSAVFLGVHT